MRQEGATVMTVLVAHASRHGATRGIAERIAQRLREAGFDVESLPVDRVRDTGKYEAAVIGSALYMFHWLGDASAFVRREGKVLGTRPVWLFSSGPIGTDRVDAEGQDVRLAAGPKEITELTATTHALDHRVFFGAYDPDAKPAGMAERFLRLMPAARSTFPAGDFRDWPEIDAWADEIAAELRVRATGAVAAGAGTGVATPASAR
jgi:menaquinone-dependent protoporphyrinogen oxidase